MFKWGTRFGIYYFTESALVQISGRVGRHPDYCTGDVFLFHFGLTRSMKQAKKHIAKMNDTAAKEFSEKQCGFN